MIEEDDENPDSSGRRAFARIGSTIAKPGAFVVFDRRAFLTCVLATAPLVACASGASSEDHGRSRSEGEHPPSRAAPFRGPAGAGAGADAGMRPRGLEQAETALGAPGTDAAIRSGVCVPTSLVREEMRIPSLEVGIDLFVMRVKAAAPIGAVVLLHGAGSASSAIWDLRFKSYSMMRKLACAGLDTYALDVRGFGGSTTPAGLAKPPEGQAPLVRAAEVMPDVAAVVALAKRDSDRTSIDLLGWSWGCDVAAMYAAAHPDDVRRLVLFAPVYDRRWPSRHIRQGGWREMHRRDLFAHIDPKNEEREPLEELADGLFRFTPGEVLRLPNGPYRDIYGEDAPVWNAASITAETLIVRGDRDPSSLDANAKNLLRALVRARSKRYRVLPGLGHFAFRERGYEALHTIIADFLAAPDSGGGG